MVNLFISDLIVIEMNKEIHVVKFLVKYFVFMALNTF